MAKEILYPKQYNEVHYIIYTPKGLPDLSTATLTMYTCIQQFIENSGFTWEEWEAKGWCCHKAIIDVRPTRDVRDIETEYEPVN